MSFPRYPKYKASGVEWLGEVPAHWEVLPCRAIVHERNDKNEGAVCQDYLSLMANVGVIPYAEKGDIGNKKPDDLSKCKMVKRGDFVINSMNYGIGSYGLSSYDGVCSSVYIVLIPQNAVVESRFAFRIFENRAFQTYAQSFGNGILEHRCSINWDILKSIQVAVPSLDEQTSILVFLDSETAKIDALVAEQRRLMDLLKEKRQAVISLAVTKGLNPDAPMKPSGIEWLGEVPAHWFVVPLKHLVIESVAGPYGASLTKAMYSTSGYRVYGQQQAITNDFAIGDYYIDEEKYSQMRRYTVFPGDVLVSVMGTIGKVAVVPKAAEPGIINPRLVRYRCGDRIAPEFMQIVLMSSKHQELLTLESNGSTMDGLNMQVLGGVPIVVPPLGEQESIIAHLKDELIEFDTLAAEAQRAIDLLQERRTALISAAVTGRIDVRQF